MKDKKFKVNFSIFLFLIYIIFIILNDYICYIAKCYAGLKTYFFALIIVITLCFILRRKVSVKMDKFNKIDIIFYIFLFFILFLRVAIPDSSFDTLNYHIYLQEKLFDDNVSYNFFPGRWVNTFSLPLGDRLHFFFRMILGYRLGMIFNLLCLIVVYYQLKRLFSKFIKKENIICIASIVVIFTEQIMTNMITYYVDLFIIPVFLEIIIMLFEKDDDRINNYYALLLGGIAIALKISNVILLLPLIIIYLYKYGKKINYKTILFGIPIFLFPFTVYMINNYIQTGNPVFPFYNNIFASKYVGLENWVEDAYGPKTLLERLLWPIYTIIYTRRAFDSDLYYGRIAFGYIISIVAIIISLIRTKERKDLLFKMSVLYIILSLIWSNFMMGYIRYVLILEILSGVIGILFIYKYIEKNKFLSFLSILVILSFMYVFFFTISDLIATNKETSWRYSYSQNKESYENNFKYLLNRRRNYDKSISDVSCFGILDYNSGYASMLTSNKPILDLHEGYNNEYGKRKLLKRLKKCENIYTVSTTNTLYRTYDYMNKLGYEQTGKVASFKTNFLNVENDLIIFEIRKKDVNE